MQLLWSIGFLTVIVAEGNFPKVWANKASDVCFSVLKKGQEGSQCITLSDTVEVTFSDVVKAVLQRKTTTTEILLETSLTSPYRQIGEERLKKVAKWMFKEPRDPGDLHQYLSSTLMNWFLGTAHKRPELAKEKPKKFDPTKPGVQFKAPPVETFRTDL